MSLSAYLAANYLTADPSAKTSNSTFKKRKRKHAHESTPKTGISIKDEYDDDILRAKAAGNSNDDDAPTTVFSNVKKGKSSGWKTVGAPAPSSREQAAADAILAGAEAERKAAGGDDDDGPTVVGDRGAVVEQPKKKKKTDKEKSDKAEEPGETIYRDATGRVINVAMARAEARRIAEEAERKEQEKKEALRGDVQKKAAEERQNQICEAKYMTLARGADDVDLNDELRARERWNDPMAGLLAEKKERSGGAGGRGKPVYKGPAEPNRYGIRPGHRWDGVDRGIGFEKEWFAARNRRQNVKELEYAWQMDE